MPRPLLPGIPGKLAEVSRWRRFTAALGAIAVVALAVGIILSTGLAASSKGASTPTKSTGSATVQRRDLVETDTESGTLSYANPQTVFNRLSGTITSLPAIGQVKKPGQTLYKVDGVPVVLFDGTIPAYRDLSEGVSDGPDVQELKQNLVALGFDPSHQITINQTYDAATAAAVDNWQSSLGETQTGTITLGQAVFLPGPQRVTSVDTVLGSTGGASGSGAGSSGSSGSSGSGSATGASTTVAPARPEFVSLTTTPAETTPAATRPAASTAATATPTTTTPTSTTPTAPCTGSSTPSSTTTTPTTTTPAPPTTPNCDQHTAGNSGSGKSPTTLAALLALLKAETLELKKSGSSPSSAGRSAGGASSSGATTGARSGGGGGGGGAGAAASASSASGGGATGSGSSGSATAQAILQTTSTQLVVTVDLDATKQTEAVVGEPVTVELPDGSNADGKITAVSPVAQTASSSSGSGSSTSGAAGGGGSSTPSATVPVTITLTGHRRVNGLDQAAVSVNFEQQKANNVLSVPVTALVATAGGGYAVQEAVAPQRLVPVTPGLFAAGYVQISGSGVFPGLQVTDSQG